MYKFRKKCGLVLGTHKNTCRLLGYVLAVIHHTIKYEEFC